MNNMKIYNEWIAEKNNNDDNAKYRFIFGKENQVHALIEMSMPGMVRYGLYTIKDNECVEYIQGWGDLRLAQMAYEVFCYEEPEIFERLNDANRQIALYDDENRRLKAIIKGMLEERYCNG